MGQYYRAIYLGSDIDGMPELIMGWLCPYEYGGYSKLMEHSYIGNDFVSAFEYELRPGGLFHKARVVWAGDYADNEFYGRVCKHGKEINEANLYHMCNSANQLHNSSKVDTSEYPYVVNHTTRKFIDKRKMGEDSDDLVIHPLPLLIAEGNGLGGGDYRGDDEELVGSWSRCSISIEKEDPSAQGYKEFFFTPREH